MNLRIAGIVKESVVDGPGIRYVVFTQGCFHNCQGCHNPQTHDINGGHDISITEIIKDVDNAPFLDGVTISGGEPVLQAESVNLLAQELNKRNINITMYSGFTFEELKDSDNISIMNLLQNIDVLVDGKFVQSERDISLKYRGSGNQRVIDVKASLTSGSIVLLYK